MLIRLGVTSKGTQTRVRALRGSEKFSEADSSVHDLYYQSVHSPSLRPFSDPGSEADFGLFDPGGPLRYHPPVSPTPSKSYQVPRDQGVEQWVRVLNSRGEDAAYRLREVIIGGRGTVGMTCMGVKIQFFVKFRWGGVIYDVGVGSGFWGSGCITGVGLEERREGSAACREQGASDGWRTSTMVRPNSKPHKATKL
eukprot:757639-Hanusia_phi.AAC.1